MNSYSNLLLYDVIVAVIFQELTRVILKIPFLFKEGSTFLENKGENICVKHWKLKLCQMTWAWDWKLLISTF